MYLKYLKYLLEHKRNVFKVCWEDRLYLHAFTHDLSKFLPDEFIPYAKKFYGNYEGEKLVKVEKDFDAALMLHYKRNKHHWNHWLGAEELKRCIPEIYIRQMICDWKAMSIKFGGAACDYYLKNYDNIVISIESRCMLEFHLGLIDGCCLCSNVTWRDYCERLGKTMAQDLKELREIAMMED